MPGAGHPGESGIDATEAAEEPEAPTHVIVLVTVAGAAGPVTRATVVEVAAPLAPGEATAWLRRAGEPELEAGIAVLNAALYAYRLAAADPLMLPVDRRQAVVARVGYGAGEEVADGRWSEMRELRLEPERRRRRRMLAPDGRLAALLTARDRALVCEELALRARYDLDAGRARHGALQLLIALDTAIAELAADPAAAGLAGRVEELRSHRATVGEAAQAALSRDLDGEELAAVEQALARVQAALRARAALAG